MADSVSGVGVLDKAVALLDAVADRPLALAELVTATGIARPTAHRLAVALERHGFLRRDAAGRFGPGSRLARRTPDLAGLAGPALARLRDLTGESAQLYVRRGDRRVCVAAADRPAGLRDSVPVGAVLPLTAGSGGQVLLAWAPPEEVARLLPAAAFGPKALAAVRRRGWAESVAEREAGVASVSAPVFGPGGVVAAVSVSGPVSRFGRTPGRHLAEPVVAVATMLSGALREQAGEAGLGTRYQ